MIFLRISSFDEAQVLEVARLLASERLAMDVNIQRDLERITLVEGELQARPLFLLTAKTRANLFSTIDARLRAMYGYELPELFSLPIVHMDWEQSRELVAVVRAPEVATSTAQSAPLEAPNALPPAQN